VKFDRIDAVFVTGSTSRRRTDREITPITRPATTLITRKFAGQPARAVTIGPKSCPSANPAGALVT